MTDDCQAKTSTVSTPGHNSQPWRRGRLSEEDNAKLSMLLSDQLSHAKDNQHAARMHA